MTRARDLSIPFNGKPGRWNAITDVAGVEVGHCTIIEGEGNLKPGKGPVRTGVTAILPLGRVYNPVFAGWQSFNGCGELTGTTWVEESGFLESAILLTETSAVGIVHNATICWAIEHIPFNFEDMRDVFWSLPVVGETYSGYLSDTFGFHIHKEHVFQALDNAHNGAVQEGNVGGGTAMICHDFKGGIGSASRLVEIEGVTYTVGALVQTNHGVRENLSIAGVPVGREIPDLMPEIGAESGEIGKSSILIILATDAPLLSLQLKRMARRAPLAIGLIGGAGANPSGDIALAFSTANRKASQNRGLSQAEFLPNALITPLFYAAIQATEEAIVNSMVAAETMTGIHNNKVYAIPHDRLQEVLKKYSRLTV